MNWSEFEFILDSSDGERASNAELTGWETVIFELDDEESAED